MYICKKTLPVFLCMSSLDFIAKKEDSQSYDSIISLGFIDLCKRQLPLKQKY